MASAKRSNYLIGNKHMSLANGYIGNGPMTFDGLSDNWKTVTSDFRHPLNLSNFNQSNEFSNMLYHQGQRQNKGFSQTLNQPANVMLSPVKDRWKILEML